jgi:hypothetical protein
VRLYNHAPFYFDHPTEQQLRERKGARSVLDLAGEILNPRRVGDHVKGDLHVLEREPTSSLAFALAEQMPHRAGMSHRGRGTLRPGAPGQPDIVESLAEVFAVELVTDPATTAGLFESVTQEEQVDFKTLTLAELKKQRPDLIKELDEAVERDDALEAEKAKSKKLEEQVTELTKGDATRARAALVTTKLAEAKLPAVLVTEAFKTQLAEAKDEAAVDALIAERKTIAKSVKPGSAPKSTERDLDETKRKDAKGADTPALEEAKLGDYARTLGLKLTTV